MTSPKYAVGDDTARGRHYIHPSRPGVELISVTNVLGQAMSKTGLIPWAAKCAVEEAWRVLPQMVAASRTRSDCAQPGLALYKQDLCGSCYGCLTRWLKSAHDRARDSASDLGVRVHRRAEAHLLGITLPREDIDDVADSFLTQYLRFLADFDVDITRDVEATELTVAHTYRGYAGTLDILLRLRVAFLDGKACLVPDGERTTALIDIKTSLTRPVTQTFPENRLQLAGLHLANEVWLPDGTIEKFSPKPTWCAVLNLRADKYELIPMPVGAPEHAAFLGALESATWQRDRWVTDRTHRPVTPKGRFKAKRGFDEDGNPKPGTKAHAAAQAAAEQKRSA